MNLAKEAYEAYANHTNWKSLATGATLPQWDELSDAIKAAWMSSAAWVAGKVSGQHDWKIPVRDKEIAATIEANAMTGDNKNDHIAADNLLCDLLESIGCCETVIAFAKVGKWYA